MAIKYSVS